MLGNVPVIVQLPNAKVASYIVGILEESHLHWKDVNEHNAALQALNGAEPTPVVIERLKKELSEMEKQPAESPAEPAPKVPPVSPEKLVGAKNKNAKKPKVVRQEVN